MPSGDGAKSLGKAFRPTPDSEVPIDRRLLHPAEQEEIEDRVVAYAKQVAQRRRMKWLPSKGSGESARPMRSDECQRVLGEAE